jgi:hypothetical protein
MSYAPENVKDAPGHCVCTINRVVVLVWKQPPVMEGVDDARHLFRAAIDRAPRDKLGYLTLMEPAAMAVNIPAAVRDGIAAMLKEFQRHIAAAVVIIDEEGFRASIVRTFVATMNVANRLEFPSSTEKSIDAATHWLATRDKGLPLDAKELTDAIHRLRKRLNVGEMVRAARG